MEISGVMIKDKDGSFFGYIKERPSICAQGKTFEEVEDKMSRYWKEYIERIGKAEVKMEMVSL